MVVVVAVVVVAATDQKQVVCVCVFGVEGWIEVGERGSNSIEGLTGELWPSWSS